MNMKSNIPGLCALLNEEIDEMEVELNAVEMARDKAHDEYLEIQEVLQEQEQALKERTRKYQQTVCVLQDLREILD